MFFKRTKPRRRIGLFGGSFNPPHIGHTAICRWVFDRGLVDELWVIPCFLHPFEKELLPFEDRLAMCKLAFGKLQLRIRVLDVERQLGGTSYTIKTIRHLELLHPHDDLFLITGDDVREQQAQWRDYEQITDIVDLIRVPRGQGSPIPDVSSTQVRERLALHEPVADLVEREVAVYIVTKGLFR